MIKINKNNLSYIAFFLLSLVVIFNRLLLPRFNTHDIFSIISWDVFGYYLYLPATFIHHDLGIKNFSWVQQILDTYHPTIGFYQAYISPGGDYIMKYPMGMAIMYAPFYFIGQILAHLTGYSPDGFTIPYQVSIAIGGLVYTLIGMWFLRKILLHFFTDQVSCVTMILIVLGTNYFQLTAFDGAMPHNYLFTLFALIFWFTIRWHENPQWKYAIFLGFLCALATLIRPTAVIIVLVPLFWGIFLGSTLRKKFLLIVNNFPQIIAFVVMMFLIIVLQMIYWKIHSGYWLYYSYEKGEKLEWIAPYLREVLVSYKKGWLLYTPLMFFSIIGFIPLFVRYRSTFLAIFMFFTTHLLIAASWPTWWYGGSFGQRSMMESYLFLALPLAALIQWIIKQHRFLKWSTLIVLFSFIFLNLFQTWQYMHLVLDPSRMTKEFYWTVFGKTKLKEFDGYYLEPTTRNDEREYIQDTNRYHSRIIASYDFEKPCQVDPTNLCKDTAMSGNFSLRMSKKLRFSPGINIPYMELSKKDFAWVQASAWVYFTCKPEEAACGLVITSNRNGTAFKYRQLELEKSNLKTGVWNKVTMDYLTPFFRDKKNTVQTYFWYRGDKELLIDDFKVRLYELK